MIKGIKIKKGIQTVLIIISIYILFVLYLLFVSDRVEKLDNKSNDEEVYYSLKIGE